MTGKVVAGILGHIERTDILTLITIYELTIKSGKDKLVAEEITRAAPISRRSVFNSLKSLERLGLISAERVTTGKITHRLFYMTPLGREIAELLIRIRDLYIDYQQRQHP